MKPTPLSPALLARLQARKRAQLVPRMRVGLLVAAALFVLFAGWESVLDATALSRTWPVRALTTLSFLGLWGLSRLPSGAARPERLLLLGVGVATASVSLLATWVPQGDVFGTGSLILVALVVGVLTPPLRTGLQAYALLLATANAVLLLRGVSLLTLFTVDLLVGSAVVAAGLMFRVSERMDAHAFQLEVTLERLASTDALSEALTRRAFEEVAVRELERARRYGHPVSLVLVDIDHFKRVNDSFGHPAGDAVIRHVAHTLRGVLRESDALGRLGGEEFAVLLPHADEAAALRLAERLRREVAGQAVEVGARQLSVTVSAGVATYQAGPEALPDVVMRADAALYAAKHAGRNRVVPAGGGRQLAH